MAKLARKFQKVFAQNATNNGQFGSAQTGSKVKSNDLDTLQSLPAYLTGWLDATISAKKLPTLEEFQALHYISNYQLSYLFQEGIPIWDTDTSYYINSIVKKTGTYEIYGSKVDDNLGNTPVDGANWQFLGNLGFLLNARKDISVKSADYTILDDDDISTLFIDDTSSDRTIDLPTLSANLNRVITIKNISTDKGNVTIDGEGAETIDDILTIDLNFKDAYITVIGQTSGWKIIDENLSSPQKQYDLTVTGTNWTTVGATGHYYRDIKTGAHRFRFNIYGSVSGTVQQITFSISGVVFRNIANFDQPCAGLTNGDLTGPLTKMTPNTGDILVRNVSNASEYGASGDVELESKPTFIE